VSTRDCFAKRSGIRACLSGVNHLKSLGHGTAAKRNDRKRNDSQIYRTVKKTVFLFLTIFFVLPRYGRSFSMNDSTLYNDTALAARFMPPGIRKAPEIDWTKFGISTGILATTITALHIYQLNAWWANQRVPFHVFDDPDYKNNFDKAGHCFG